MNMEQLLIDIKNYIDITWDDADTNKKIRGITSRGMYYLDTVAGGQQNYEEEGQARALLFEYVLYVNSGALSEFQQNYLHELMMLQIHQEVKSYEEEQIADIQ